jgi:hypothetical protein
MYCSQINTETFVCPGWKNLWQDCYAATGKEFGVSMKEGKRKEKLQPDPECTVVKEISVSPFQKAAGRSDVVSIHLGINSLVDARSKWRGTGIVGDHM